MGFVIRDSNTGLKAAWEAAQTDVDDGGGDTHIPDLIAPGDSNLRYYLKLSYDRSRDRIIVSNGDSGKAVHSFSYIKDLYHEVDDFIGGDLNHTYHVAFDAETLDPSLSLTATDATRWLYPLQGACMAFVSDHNTGQFYGVNGLRYRDHPNTGATYTQDYGGYPMALYELTPVLSIDQYFAIEFLGQTVMPEAGNVYNETLALAVATVSAAPIPLKGSEGVVLAAPVLMDDVIAFAFGFGPVFGGYLYVATLQGQWISSRPLRLSYVLAVCSIGVDRFIVVGSLSGGVIEGTIQPLTVFTFRYDRIRNSVILDDVSGLPTEFEYKYPDHVGFMTFDSQRGALVLLSPDLTTIERHVFDVQCHPIAPNRLLRPVPVQPLHAGRNIRFVGATLKGAAAVQSRGITVDYGTEVPQGNFTTFTGQFRTRSRDGTGTFTIGLTSATEGQTLALTAFTSTFSVVLSAQTANGQKFGNDPMALQSDTALFEVSATLSASPGGPGTTGTVNTSSVIVSRRPLLQSDAGGGSQRELEYPQPSPFATPIVYPFNPQQWTNFLTSPLSRPFYKETQTLGKTITVEYEKNQADVQIVETWMGGGNRMSMPISFFADLYEYFAHPPDITNQGYIVWRPRDLTAVAYRVVIVNLEVGGVQDSILFDNYVKQGVGTLHDEVRLTLRIVEEA